MRLGTFPVGLIVGLASVYDAGASHAHPVVLSLTPFPALPARHFR